MVCFADVGTVRTWYHGPGMFGSLSPVQRTMIQSVERVQQLMTTRDLSTESAVVSTPPVARGETDDLRQNLETANADSTLDIAAEVFEANADSTLDMAAEVPQSDSLFVNTTTLPRWSPRRPPTPGISVLLPTNHDPALPLHGDALTHLV